MIRVVLIDDHALMREGMTRLLEQEPDMRVVASFADGHAAVRFAARRSSQPRNAESTRAAT